MNMQGHINANNAIFKRFMASEFRMRSRDGKLTGGSDKIPVSVSTKPNTKDSVWNKPSYKAKKANQRSKNKAARAELNQKLAQSSSNFAGPAGYHTTLNAINKGTY